jgi:ATP-dependent protease ClpP protease subunit
MKRIISPHTGSFDNWSTPMLIQEIEKAGEDVELAYTSFGGSTAYGQELARFLNSHTSKVSADVSGMVASMGFYILPFFKHVKGAEQADLMIHSVISNAAPTEHTAQFFYKALSKKINKEKFAEITGFKLKEVVFAKGEERKNIWITGKQAGEIGLFDETYSLLNKAADLGEFNIPNHLAYEVPTQIKEKYAKVADIIITDKKQNDMDISTLTKEALKSGNPIVYAAIVKEERERVAKISKYAKFDEKRAQEIIEGGNPLSIEDVEHFMEKKAGLEKVADLESGSEGGFVPTKTTKNEPVVAQTPEQKEAAEKQAELDMLDAENGVDSMIEKHKK